MGYEVSGVRAWLVTSVLVAGCGPNDPADPTLRLHLTIDHGVFDSVVLYSGWGGTLAIGSPSLPTAPVTPAMLAAGQAPRADAIVAHGDVTVYSMSSPASQDDIVLQMDPLGPLVGGHTSFVVFLATAPVAGTALDVTDIPQSPGQSADASVPLVSAGFEAFGPAASSRACALITSVDPPVYDVIAGDDDCDGIADAQDCKPSTYCDPSATSGPAHDACVCP